MTEATNPKRKSSARPVAAVVMLLALAVLLGCGYLWWRQYQSPMDRYAKVLEALKNHQIQGTENGRLDLTKQFPGITGQNDAYVTYRDDGSFAAMFPTYYGPGSAVVGLYYTSRKLTADDTHPRISAIRYDDKLVQAGSYANLILDKRIDDNWYEVSYRMH
jgi:hypothetical protein